MKKVPLPEFISVKDAQAAFLPVTIVQQPTTNSPTNIYFSQHLPCPVVGIHHLQLCSYWNADAGRLAVPYVLGLSIMVGDVDLSLLNRPDQTHGQDHDVALCSEGTSLSIKHRLKGRSNSFQLCKHMCVNSEQTFTFLPHVLKLKYSDLLIAGRFFISCFLQCPIRTPCRLHCMLIPAVPQDVSQLL